MHRESIPNRGRNLLAFQPDEGAGRLVGSDRIDEKHLLRVLDVRQQRQAERAAVEDGHPIRDVEAAREGMYRSGTQTVVAAEHVAEPEHQQGGRLLSCHPSSSWSQNEWLRNRSE